MADHNALGKLGEIKAMEFLQSKGYKILRQNFYYNKGEVDILAQIEDLLVVVEVKTRSSAIFGDPQDFLKPKQINRIVEATDAFMTLNNIECEVRFDIIAIVISENDITIEHLEDAFYHF